MLRTRGKKIRLPSGDQEAIFGADRVCERSRLLSCELGVIQASNSGMIKRLRKIPEPFYLYTLFPIPCLYLIRAASNAAELRRASLAAGM